MINRAPADANLDHETLTRIQTRLSTSNFARLRHLSVEVEAGHIVLHGRVSSFYERQVAVALADRASGDSRVIDRLSVDGASLGRAAS